MGFISNMAAANIGVIAANSGKIVRLLTETNQLLRENLVYLAQQKAHEVEQERRRSMVATGGR